MLCAAVLIGGWASTTMLSHQQENGALIAIISPLDGLAGYLLWRQVNES